MLTFKEYLKEIYLVEAKAEHFPHIELNPENPEHKDLIDAYNNGLNAESGKKTMTKLPKPGQIKSIEQFKDVVKPHLKAIVQKRQEDKKDQEAFNTGRATVIHHNPKTGLIITQVGDQRSSCATPNTSSNFCTTKRNSPEDMVLKYDPEGNKSFHIYAPKENQKIMRHIGAFGEYQRGRENHQGAENNELSDNNWNSFRTDHSLDNIKHLKGSMRGIGITQVEKDQYSKELTHNIKNGTVSTPDVAHAITNGYLTDEHKNALLDNKTTKPGILDKLASDKNTHEKILNHPNVDDMTLAQIARSTTNIKLHKAILGHHKAADETLATLVEHSNSPEVHKAIVQHKNVNVHTLNALAEHSNSPEVHKAIVQHKNVSDQILGTVAQSTNDPEVHKAILQHKNVHHSVLDAIAENTHDPEVHNAILQHKNTDDIILSSIAQRTYDPEIYKALIAHKKASDFSLADIAACNQDPEIQKAIVAHKNAGEYALRAVGRWASDPELQKAIELKHKQLENI